MSPTQAAQETDMFANVLNPRRNTRNATRSAQLSVEFLEGRSLPSTLGMGAITAATPHLLGSQLNSGGQVQLCITRSSGEEIPQTVDW
jgi:hypothetical protein